MIYISKFISIVKLPDGKVPISIAKNSPPWYKEKKLIEYPDLAPDTDNPEDYEKKLYSLSALNIVDKLINLIHSRKKDIVLVMYDNWQYDMIKTWLQDNGFEPEEYSNKKEI